MNEQVADWIEVDESKYNQIKRDFADAGEGAYRAAKSRFIEQVLAR